MIDNRATLDRSEAHGVALECATAGIEAALPERVVADAVDVSDDTLRVGSATYDLTDWAAIVVVGGGNAAGHLVAALDAALGDRGQSGVVVTDDPVGIDRIDTVEGSHPIPDAAAVEGATRILDRVREAGPETLVLAAITGGGSALLPAPAAGIELADLQATTDALVRSGASIAEINAVRKHLSAIKGGRLARAAAPATTVGLVMSDVVGNRLDVIASGPLVPDDSTFADALAALDEYDVTVPASVRERLETGAAGSVPETPTAGDPAFETVDVRVIADGMTALSAAAEAAERRGYEPLVLSSRVRGEASEVAPVQVAVAEEIAATGTPVDPPAVVLAGGETTVTVAGDGRGGPNQEFALAGAIELDAGGIALCAVDTDGIDGATDAAGAVVDRETADPAGDARAALRANDVYPFLDGQDALVETGPTGTNVNDLQVLAVENR